MADEVQTEEEKKIYSIPSWNVDTFYKKVKALNKKAAKIGCPPLEIIEHGTASYIHPDYDEMVEMGIRTAADVPHYTVHRLELTGEGPKLAGWKFLGTLDHNTLPGSVIVNTVPGEHVPTRFYHNSAVCDHCGKTRRRNETFVVEHEEGEMKQVGRQCIRDFLGHDPNALVRMLASIRRLFDQLDGEDEMFFGGGVGNQDMHFEHVRVLEVASAMIRTYGWVSKSMAEHDYDLNPTANEVLSYFCPPAERAAREQWTQWKETINFNEKNDACDASDALQWLDDQEAGNEYIHNLQAIARAEAVPTRMFGYWCSLVATYQRAQDRLRQQALTKKTNEWAGEVKQRLDFTVKVTSIQHMDSYYGVVHLHKMLDSEGRTLVWFANTDSGMDAGRSYRIKGTVKKLDEYKDWKQTSLSRVKMLEEITE